MFFEIIKSLANEKKLSINQLERELGYSRNSLANYKSKKSKPSAKRVDELAKFFNVSTDYLLGNTDKRSSQLDIDLDEALDKSVAYDGNELSENDREAIKYLLKDYFAKKDGNL
ncbi:helix-turn-helix domain-containing protein [Lactococcus insecticola]|uniref:Transcriptional regulator n=1 Tax=Pseudolactococcus insecticola TaxID=2709158 RepID=A0A6A0B851_9LACT|nr:helix-turn-helix transcriptional regulator [Lactococcus insecticola]GFH40843.1 transcriptional regulator [Lactococcus insecticola]